MCPSRWRVRRETVGHVCALGRVTCRVGPHDRVCGGSPRRAFLAGCPQVENGHGSTGRPIPPIRRMIDVSCFDVRNRPTPAQKRLDLHQKGKLASTFSTNVPRHVAYPIDGVVTVVDLLTDTRKPPLYVTCNRNTLSPVFF